MKDQEITGPAIHILQVQLFEFNNCFDVGNVRFIKVKNLNNYDLQNRTLFAPKIRQIRPLRKINIALMLIIPVNSSKSLHRQTA